MNLSDDRAGPDLIHGDVVERFGVAKSGVAVERYTLTNRGGSVARVMTHGATLTELWVRDREGRLGDVVLGFDSLAGYERPGPYFGSIIGRVANRIARARFSLDGVEFELDANDGVNHIHGGRVGFDKVVWDAETSDGDDGPAVIFSHTSPDGDQGYPGSLAIRVTYRLDHEDTLHIEYHAECDAPTPVNLTNHSYWNLSGRGDVLDHELRLEADRYTEVDEALIPTGRLLPVADTPFDFRAAKPIGRDMASHSIAYDHNFVLADRRRDHPAIAGELHDPDSGRRMTFSSTEPGVQLYTGNSLHGVAGKRSAVHDRHAALCLEAQHFPDALHHAAFPSIVLRPGAIYRQVTLHRFTAD